MFLRISLTILGLLALAIGIRMYELAEEGLNREETVTLSLINGYAMSESGRIEGYEELPKFFTRQDIRGLKTYGNVVSATIRQNGNSVAYNIMLSWWTKVFGNTNYSIRFLSLVFGVLTVMLGYYFARQLFNGRTAVIAGIMLCMHPLLVEYAQLARAYIPATFFVLLSTYSLYQISVSKAHLWLHIPLYVIAVMLTMLCHYLAIYVLVAHVLLVLFFHSHRKAMIQYAIMSAVMLGLFALWWFNGGITGKEWNDLQSPYLKGNDGVVVDQHFIINLLVNTTMLFGIPSSVFMAAVLLLITGVVIFFANQKIRKSEYFRQVMFVLFPIGLYYVFVLLAAWQIDRKSAFDMQYASFTIPFVCILLAFGFDRMLDQKLLIRYCSMAIMAVFGITYLAAFVKQQPKALADPFPYHHSADFIEQNAGVADLVVFNNYNDALMTNFYFNKNNAIMQTVREEESEPSRVILYKGENVVANYNIRE